MKVQSTSILNYDAQAPKVKYTHKPNINNVPVKNDVSFGSGFGSALKSLTAGAFKKIDAVGFLLEFLIIDTISMVIPRIVVGLNRDKEKTGKTNYKAGLEEAGRECLSGPSMNLIPMGVLALFAAVNSATRMSKETLKSFTGNMEKVAKQMGDFMSKETAGGAKSKINESLASKIYDEAFAGYKFKNIGDKSSFKKEFVELLTANSNSEKKGFKANLETFEKLISKINNKNTSSVTTNSKGIKLGKGVDARTLFEDFKYYSNDVIEKLINKTSKLSNGKNLTEEATTFLKKALGSRMNLKFLTAFSAFMAVGGFLLYLPKLYQQKGLSPAQESAKLAMAEVAKGGINEVK